MDGDMEVKFIKPTEVNVEKNLLFQMLALDFNLLYTLVKSFTLLSFFMLTLRNLQ